MKNKKGFSISRLFPAIAHNKTLDELSDKLNSFPKCYGGLVSDESRSDPEYQQAKKAYNSAFSEYRKFNSLKESKAFSRKAAAERWAKKMIG